MTIEKSTKRQKQIDKNLLDPQAQQQTETPSPSLVEALQHNQQEIVETLAVITPRDALSPTMVGVVLVVGMIHLMTPSRFLCNGRNGKKLKADLD